MAAIHDRPICTVTPATRSIFPPGLFVDASWDILLELSICESQGKKMSVSSACIPSAVPPTTALRHIGKSVELQLVERIDDPDDARRVYVKMSPKAFSALQWWENVAAEEAHIRLNIA